MFEWTAFLADLVVIGWCGLRHTAMEAVQVVADARLLVPTLRHGEHATTRSRLLTRRVGGGCCLRLCADFSLRSLLMKVEPPSESEGTEASVGSPRTGMVQGFGKLEAHHSTSPATGTAPALLSQPHKPAVVCSAGLQ